MDVLCMCVRMRVQEWRAEGAGSLRRRGIWGWEDRRGWERSAYERTERSGGAVRGARCVMEGLCRAGDWLRCERGACASGQARRESLGE